MRVVGGRSADDRVAVGGWVVGLTLVGAQLEWELAPFFRNTTKQVPKPAGRILLVVVLKWHITIQNPPKSLEYI